MMNKLISHVGRVFRRVFLCSVDSHRIVRDNPELKFFSRGVCADCGKVFHAIPLLTPPPGIKPPLKSSGEARAVIHINMGDGLSEEGPGIKITLDGNQVATAIDLYLKSQGVGIIGPRTTRIDGELCQPATIYVDPSGYVKYKSMFFSGKTGLPDLSPVDTTEKNI